MYELTLYNVELCGAVLTSRFRANVVVKWWLIQLDNLVIELFLLGRIANRSTVSRRCGCM